MKIPVFGLGVAAKSPFVTAKTMQNVYAETRPWTFASQEKSMLVGYQTPGLNLFVDFGATPCRGGIELESLSLMYTVQRGTFYEVNNSGVMTSRGTLTTTSGRVAMAHNGVQVMMVDGTNGYVWNTSTLVFTQITDPNFPANPTGVVFLSGRFIVTTSSSGNTARFYPSEMYDGTTWPGLYASTETQPGRNVTVWASNGQLVLFKDKGTEFWGNSGSLDFPFSLIVGTATEWGLASQWSVAKYDNSLAMLVRNRMGQVMVAKLNGYLPEKISTPDIDSIINGYSNVADATSYSYMLGGHPMYAISFPSAGASWLYDGSTGFWSKLKSYGLTRHRGEFAFPFLGNTIVADNSLGRLYKLSASALTDNGDPIERVLISETVADPDLDRLEVNKFRIDCEVGNSVTSGQGSNAQIALSVSRDNGKTFGSEMWRNLGKIGEYATTVDWPPLGTARNFVFKLSITDPVNFVIVSASVNPPD